MPTDPAVLQKMATIYDNDGDKQQAYQYHFDSYRYFPSNLEVIDWLGSYFIEMQVRYTHKISAFSTIFVFIPCYVRVRMAQQSLR